MHIKTKDLILTALFAALTAAGAFIKIPLGPVPFTLQFFFTALSGILLGPYLGSLSQLIYVLIGLIGIPVFTSGGGPTYIFNPSFGYLLGFIFASFIIGKITYKARGLSLLKLFSACIIGAAAIYSIGIPYMYMILRYVSHSNMTFFKVMELGFFVFIPGDIAKCIIASIIGVKIAPAIKNI